MGLHIVKRENCPLWKRCCFYLIAVLVALGIGSVILLAIGVNPVAYYTRMFTLGTIGNKIAYKTYINYLKDFVPLALTSLGLSLAFKMRFGISAAKDSLLWARWRLPRLLFCWATRCPRRLFCC